MKILIDYEASWRNSFLDGDNNIPVPKGGRTYIASITELKAKENYIARQVTKDTVMGVLNRLVGDVRRLYQSRQSDDYYFAGMEDKITFIDHETTVNEEIIFLRNLKGSFDRNSFTGMIVAENPVFTAEYAKEFWGVLALNVEQLCEFILHDKPIFDFYVDNHIGLDPISITNRFATLGKEKMRPFEGGLKSAVEVLVRHFPKYKPTSQKGLVIISSLYCSALYLQLNRLEKQFDMSDAKAKQGGIKGISHNNMTASDFMRAYTTGKSKLIYGNPYIQAEFLKGEGKVYNKLKKASGQLEINFDIDLETARDLIEKIDCAGVNSFYLGKKGLAYISDISI